MIALFHQAKAEDPDALYRISKYYEKGSYGFPKSSYRAGLCRLDAAYLGHKRAKAEIAYNDYLEDDSLDMKKSSAARLQLQSLAREGESYAVWALQRIEEDDEAVRQYFKKVNCIYCNGTGKVPGSRREYYHPEVDYTRVEWDRCTHCNGTGRKDKRDFSAPGLIVW